MQENDSEQIFYIKSWEFSMRKKTGNFILRKKLKKQNSGKRKKFFHSFKLLQKQNVLPENVNRIFIKIMEKPQKVSALNILLIHLLFITFGYSKNLL